METMSREELVAILGEEAANEIIAQREEAGKASGGKIPFTFLNKINDMLGNDLGKFGEFVVGVEKSKDESGNTIITNKGVNLGTSFEFLNVTSCFYYKKFTPGTKDAAGKVFMSNIMRTLGDIDKAVDFNGNPLPKSKDEKKAQGWKLVRMNAGLVRKSPKDAWIPCIFEVDGTMLFGFNNVADKDTSGKRGVLTGITKIVTGIDKKGQIPYVVIDDVKSTFEQMPVGVIKDQAENIANITIKMKDYVNSRQGNVAATPAANTQAPTTSSEVEAW